MEGQVSWSAPGVGRLYRLASQRAKLAERHRPESRERSQEAI